MKGWEYLLSTAISGKGALIDTLSLYLVDNWHVRKDQSHVLFGDVAIAIEIVTINNNQWESMTTPCTYMSNDSLIFVSRLL